MAHARLTPFGLYYHHGVDSVKNKNSAGYIAAAAASSFDCQQCHVKRSLSILYNADRASASPPTLSRKHPDLNGVVSHAYTVSTTASIDIATPTADTRCTIKQSPTTLSLVATTPTRTAKHGHSRRLRRRPTHFVAWRLANPSFHTDLTRVQNECIKLAPELSNHTVPPIKAHITGFVVYAPTPEAVNAARSVMRDLAPLARTLLKATATSASGDAIGTRAAAPWPDSNSTEVVVSSGRTEEALATRRPFFHGSTGTGIDASDTMRRTNPDDRSGSSIRVRLRGIDAFGSRVMYTCVHQDDQEALRPFLRAAYLRFATAYDGSLVDHNDGNNDGGGNTNDGGEAVVVGELERVRPWTAHVTLFKVRPSKLKSKASKGKAGKKKTHNSYASPPSSSSSSSSSSGLTKKASTVRQLTAHPSLAARDFGAQQLSPFSLCPMQGVAEDGYYHQIESIGCMS